MHDSASIEAAVTEASETLAHAGCQITASSLEPLPYIVAIHPPVKRLAKEVGRALLVFAAKLSKARAEPGDRYAALWRGVARDRIPHIIEHGSDKPLGEVLYCELMGAEKSYEYGRCLMLLSTDGLRRMAPDECETQYEIDYGWRWEDSMKNPLLALIYLAADHGDALEAQQLLTPHAYG